MENTKKKLNKIKKKERRSEPITNKAKKKKLREKSVRRSKVFLVKFNFSFIVVVVVFCLHTENLVDFVFFYQCVCV